MMILCTFCWAFSFVFCRTMQMGYWRFSFSIVSHSLTGYFYAILLKHFTFNFLFDSDLFVRFILVHFLATYVDCFSLTVLIQIAHYFLSSLRAWYSFYLTFCKKCCIFFTVLCVSASVLTSVCTPIVFSSAFFKFCVFFFIIFKRYFCMHL